MVAVVMAGGLGARMRPLTYTIPKPLLPIGERPILEIILIQLKRAGFTRAFITTGYQADLVKSYFGDGSRFGVSLEYTTEPETLGTAGAVFLLRGIVKEPFLVMNCDVLTGLDLARFYKHHLDSDAQMTVGAVNYCTEIPYGVLQVSGGLVREVVEKPRTSHLVLAGIYAMNPEVFDFHRSGRIDIPELVGLLLEAKKKVAVFEITEPWIDVGRMSDYERASNEFKHWGKTD
ncbi:MAG: sugar phosphate nucleotidyltransferase [Candidatus Eisenbacteria bacterium]